MKNGCKTHSFLPVPRGQLQTSCLAGAMLDAQQCFLSVHRGKNRRGRREGGRPDERKAISLLSLFSSQCWTTGKTNMFTMLVLYFLSLFLFKMAQSCYSPMNTGKTVPHLLFSPHFRHHLLTSPIARSPCFRFPSSYNYPYFSFPHSQGVMPHLSGATCQKQTSFKSLCDFAHT